MQRIILAVIESAEKEKPVCVFNLLKDTCHLRVFGMAETTGNQSLLSFAGAFDVLMPSRTEHRMGRREKGCPGQPPRNPTTSQLPHHGQDMAALNGTPQGPKPWGSHSLLATPNTKLSENVSSLILSKSPSCMTEKLSVWSTTPRQAWKMS